MGAHPGGDAMRLLRAINAYQAHGRVGFGVLPFAVAGAAGLEPATEPYEEAVWRLLWEKALTANECFPPQVVAGLPFGRASYRLAPAALRMLEMA